MSATSWLQAAHGTAGDEVRIIVEHAGETVALVYQTSVIVLTHDAARDLQARLTAGLAVRDGEQISTVPTPADPPSAHRPDPALWREVDIREFERASRDGTSVLMTDEHRDDDFERRFYVATDPHAPFVPSGLSFAIPERGVR